MEASGTNSRCSRAVDVADHDAETSLVSSLFSADCYPKVSDQDLYRSVQGILPMESDASQVADCIKKGTTRSL